MNRAKSPSADEGRGLSAAERLPLGMIRLDPEELPPSLAAAHRKLMLVLVEAVLATDKEARRHSAPPVCSPAERAFVLALEAGLRNERNITPSEIDRLLDLFKRGGESPYATLDAARYIVRYQTLKRLAEEARRRGEW